jgi:hypothetical protein
MLADYSIATRQNSCGDSPHCHTIPHPELCFLAASDPAGSPFKHSFGLREAVEQSKEVVASLFFPFSGISFKLKDRP